MIDGQFDHLGAIEPGIMSGACDFVGTHQKAPPRA